IKVIRDLLILYFLELRILYKPILKNNINKAFFDPVKRAIDVNKIIKKIYSNLTSVTFDFFIRTINMSADIAMFMPIVFAFHSSPNISAPILTVPRDNPSKLKRIYIAIITFEKVNIFNTEQILYLLINKIDKYIKGILVTAKLINPSLAIVLSTDHIIEAKTNRFTIIIHIVYLLILTLLRIIR